MGKSDRAWLVDFLGLPVMNRSGLGSVSHVRQRTSILHMGSFAYWEAALPAHIESD